MIPSVLRAEVSDTVQSALTEPAHYVGADVRAAWLVPNSEFFKGENELGKRLDKTVSAYLKYAFSYAPDSRQGRMYPHTYQGIGVGYHNFFDTKEVGNPLSLYVLQGSRIARLSPRLTLDYEWNFGASFGWKKYDEIENWYNTVVGSRMNAYINAGFMLNYRLSHDLNMTFGIDISHFSNGNTSYPNEGVNTIGARIGIVKSFGSSAAAEPSLPHIFVEPHISYDLVIYGATRKRAIIGENDKFMVPGTFAIVGLNFNPLYNFNNYFAAGASLDVQYDESANIKDHVASDDGSTAGEATQFYRPPFSESLAAGLSLRAELIMPIFSINVGIGHNVIYKGSDNGGFYQLVVLKAHVMKNLFLHVGYRLINFKDPSNLMLGIGYRFGNRR